MTTKTANMEKERSLYPFLMYFFSLLLSYFAFSVDRPLFIWSATFVNYDDTALIWSHSSFKQ